MSYLDSQRFKVRVGVVLLDDNNRLLLARQNKRDFWVLPGGTLEPEETMDQCAVREIKEETNLDIGPPRFLYIADFFKPSGKHIIDVVFTAPIIGGSLERETTENIDDLRFFTLEEFNNAAVKPQAVFDRILESWQHNQWPQHALYIGRYS